MHHHYKAVTNNIVLLEQGKSYRSNIGPGTDIPIYRYTDISFTCANACYLRLYIILSMYICRQTRDIGGSPHSSSPTEVGRRGRTQYASSPLLGERESKRSPSHPIIEEVRKMPTSVGISKNGLLAQQIHEEFLCCKICLDSFTNPKSLNCLHTFCEECIENHANSESSYKKYSDYREFTCPLCRKRTTLPLGGVRKLPDNFLVSSLTEVIDRQKPSKFPFCDICKLVSRKHNEASSKCLDCNKMLCKGCVDQHLNTKVGVFTILCLQYFTVLSFFP